MADRGVRKTKDAIKKALEEVLSEKNFDQITVTEICDKADISRITFYTHYEDKFTMVEEIFSDMLEWATERYYEKEKANNTEGDIIKTFSNLSDSIFDLYDNEGSLLSKATIDNNPYLHYSFYNRTTHSLETVFEHRSDRIKLKYPISQVSGFICSGFGGFINGFSKVELSSAREFSKNVLAGILRANIVTESI